MQPNDVSDHYPPTGPEADSVVPFVEEYVAAENDAYRTGDVSMLEDMIGEHCLDCNETVSCIEAAYGEGNRLDGYLLKTPLVELRPGRLEGGGYPCGSPASALPGRLTTHPMSRLPAKGWPERVRRDVHRQEVDGAWHIIGG